jgi:hypothetical protein
MATRDDDFKSQLGGFMRAALAQLDTVREVAVQKSKQARIQLDVAMLKRQRKDVLAELGEAVARLAARGRLTEEDYPELSAPLARLEALDERIEDETARARKVGDAGPSSSSSHGRRSDGDDSDDEEYMRDKEELDRDDGTE